MAIYSGKRPTSTLEGLASGLATLPSSVFILDESETKMSTSRFCRVKLTRCNWKGPAHHYSGGSLLLENQTLENTLAHELGHSVTTILLSCMLTGTCTSQTNWSDYKVIYDAGSMTEIVSSLQTAIRNLPDIEAKALADAWAIYQGLGTTHQDEDAKDRLLNTMATEGSLIRLALAKPIELFQIIGFIVFRLPNDHICVINPHADWARAMDVGQPLPMAHEWPDEGRHRNPLSFFFAKLFGPRLLPRLNSEFARAMAAVFGHDYNTL
jgi:hypothetical protein